MHSHEPTGQTKCLLADECEKSECPLAAESSKSRSAPAVSRRPLTSHFAVKDGFPSDLGRLLLLFFKGGWVKSVCAAAPLVCCVTNAFGAKAEAGAAGHWRVPEIN